MSLYYRSGAVIRERDRVTLGARTDYAGRRGRVVHVDSENAMLVCTIDGKPGLWDALPTDVALVTQQAEEERALALEQALHRAVTALQAMLETANKVDETAWLDARERGLGSHVCGPCDAAHEAIQDGLTLLGEGAVCPRCASNGNAFRSLPVWDGATFRCVYHGEWRR